MRGDKPVKRRYRVNADRCPVLVECLEKQAYDKNGEPDKVRAISTTSPTRGLFSSLTASR
jgi:hypothetical protein